ncbi:MAG TPA: hypothetical protein VI815_02845 [Candidatus Nanoarchaeia archaeon]|nr:hypothetical protein [Candidatus Nanoarchaeia archaeon]
MSRKDNIADIRSNFIAKTFRGQKVKAISPAGISGGLSLSYERGKQEGIYISYRFLKKINKEIATKLFDALIYEDGRKR